jgi:hypothetical protein
MKRKLLWIIGGIVVIIIIANQLDIGPYRPRFPIAQRTGVPYPYMTVEEENLFAEIRDIGLKRDLSRIDKVRHALLENHPAILIAASLALGRLGTKEAIDDLHALQARLASGSEVQPFIALALARIEAERDYPNVTDENQLQRKMKRFLQAAKVSVSQIHKGALWYTEQLKVKRYGRAPFEVQVLRQAAEIAVDAYQRGVKDAFKIVGLNFSLDYVAQLKVRLAQMSKEQRISWLVDILSKKQVARMEEDYLMQALADEGEEASKAIIAKLKEIKLNRDKYHYVSFMLLFRTLTCIGDPDAIPVIQSFSNEPDWLGYYAEQAIKIMKEGRRTVRAVDY